jgi:hypothetical protein
MALFFFGEKLDLSLFEIAELEERLSAASEANKLEGWSHEIT